VADIIILTYIISIYRISDVNGRNELGLNCSYLQLYIDLFDYCFLMTINFGIKRSSVHLGVKHRSLYDI